MTPDTRHPTPGGDHLARTLDRARALHERHPDDGRIYVAYLEAQIAFLRFEVARRDRAIARERRKAAEIGRRLKRANALVASAIRPARRDKRRGASVGERPGQKEFWQGANGPAAPLQEMEGARP